MGDREGESRMVKYGTGIGGVLNAERMHEMMMMMMMMKKKKSPLPRSTKSCQNKINMLVSSWICRIS